MESGPTGNCIVFNGELYNTESLRRELKARGHSFRGSSDTEIALLAYDEWGPACFERFKGMFALALWEGGRERLILARDRLGIKPLYVYKDGAELAFASEARALLASGLVPRRLAEVGVASFLATGGVEEPATIIDGLEALPPGFFAVSEPDGLTLHQYWSLEHAFGKSSAETPSRSQMVAQLRAKLEEVIERHLVADVPLGVFLSGGIDSTSVAALTRASREQPVVSVGVGFPGDLLSEEAYIRRAAESLGTQHAQLELSEDVLLAELPSALEAIDQPTFDGINTWFASRAARSAGLTVALSGLGGDELFAGYQTFRNVLRLGRLKRLPATTRRAVGAGAGPILGRSVRGQKLAQWLAQPGSVRSAYDLSRQLFGPPDRRSLMRPNVPPLPGEPALDIEDPLNAVSALELTHYTRNVLLRDSDAMSMAHSLELRVPLLDHELVELAASWPGRAKLDGPYPKALLVDAVGELLPSGVAGRKKMGFSLPFERWLRGPLRAEVASVLKDRDFGGAAAEMLEPGAAERVWRRFEAGTLNWHHAWALYVLKNWGERHTAGSPPASPSPQHGLEALGEPRTS